MATFFVLNDINTIVIPENYTGYIVFYAKSLDETVEAIQTNFFTKLIENALKLKLDSFLFVDVNLQKVRFSAFQKKMEIKKCFLFGVNPSTIGINFNLQPYQLKSFSTIDFLQVDTVEAIEKDKNLKTKLWAQLQISYKL